MTTAYNYTSPVDKLLTYGDCRELKGWPNYLELGFTHEHIPELIRMATDDDLLWADSDSLEVWAPVHAWRTLGQLQAEEAVEPLISLFHKSEEDDEWVLEDLSLVFEKIGAYSLPALDKYISDTNLPNYARIRAAHSLELLSKHYPAMRDKCIAVFTRELGRFTENNSMLNAELVSNLLDLKAVESLSTIREAFERECVDFTVNGDVEDIEIEFGVRKKRSTPMDYPTLQDLFPYLKEMAKLMQEEKAQKTGRNDPCPCGSGKKYKKCCLNKAIDPKDETIREFISMSSKKQIVFSNKAQKQKLLDLIERGQFVPAIKLVQNMTGAEKRLVREYIERLREQL